MTRRTLLALGLWAVPLFQPVSGSESLADGLGLAPSRAPDKAAPPSNRYGYGYSAGGY